MNFRFADAANHVNRDPGGSLEVTRRAWCEALFSGFSGFGFGRVGRSCQWAGLADQGSDDLPSQHVLEI